MDSKSLDEIMSERDAPVTTEAAEVEQPKADATVRDDKGRFAPKQDEQPASSTEQQPHDDEADTQKGNIPPSAIAASRQKEREARQEAEQLRQRLAQMEGQLQVLTQQRQPQQPATEQEKPDFWTDPDGYLKTAISPVEQRISQQFERMSKTIAVQQHGQEAVDNAYSALVSAVQTNPAAVAGEYQRIMNSDHPFGELVSWHQRQQTLAEIGTDPKAYREKLRAEIVAEMQANAAAQAQQSPAAKPVMPTSFATARNEGPRSQPTYSGPKPLSEIMDR